MPPALCRSELTDSDPIAASRLPDCVERLMYVADKVNEELQGFDAVIPWCIAIGENLLEYLDPVHHAVVVVGCGILVPAVGQKTVPLVGKPGGILGNIYKMPVVRFVAIWSNFVRPVRDGCEARIADQGANPDFRVLGQPGLGQRRHDFVPFMPPTDKRRGYEQCQGNDRCREAERTSHRNCPQV